MIHIVFNEADVDTLKSAMELDPEMLGEVVLIRDDYAVGPISNLYETEGRTARTEWWSSVLEGGDYEHLIKENSIDDHQTISGVIDRLRTDDSETIWIWAAQNQHDVSGYYFLLHYLKEFQGRVFILYLNNLPFINEKGGIFYPEWISEIPPKEFLKAKKLARPITTSEFEVDPDEWNRLAMEEKGVRILEGGKKLLQHDFDFFDNDLKRYITPALQKASKVIHQYLSKAKNKTGDAYLLWRLKTMIEDGKMEAQGKIAAMKDFEVKTRSTSDEKVDQN